MELLAAAAVLAGFLIVLELAIRFMGLGAVPLFESAAHGIYRMKANQSGRFRRRIGWKYDANGMRNEEAPVSFGETTLLIGDSIVDGGISVDQSETLATVAARKSGERFYTVACHGWALANSLPALRALPAWNGAKRLVFVLNTGDLDAAVELEDELSFPTRSPPWLTLWLVRRHMIRRFGVWRPRDAAARRSALVAAQDWRAANLAAFGQLLADFPGPVVLVRYAMRGEDARTERFFERLASLDRRVQILEAAEAPGWSEDCYVDHIHPNARGTEALARHLCQGLS